MSEVAALLVLAASLVAAVTRPRWAPEWIVAAAGALLLMATGVLSFHGAR
jgi:Na+/H+ antiporter NhaD/arsenite permease-like protein